MTIEIVRFTVPVDRQAELLAGHAEVRRAIARVAPGARWSRLARVDARTWLEVVGWGDAAQLERALELAPADPTAGAWFGLAEPGWTIATGALVATSQAPPPADGALHLTWWARGESGADRAVAAHRATWSALLDVAGRIWVDPAGWVEREPSTLVLSGSPVAGGAAIHETAEIEHAVDHTPDPGGANDQDG